MPVDLCEAWQSVMANYRYHYFDTTISSTRCMMGLPRYRGQTELEYCEVDYPLVTGREQWIQDWNRGSTRLLVSCARMDGGYLFRHDTIGDYQIDLQLRTIVCHPNSSADDESLQHFLLDQVIPRTLGQLGSTIVHASAVRPCDSDTVIAFVGSSGAGKSTMAASFINDSGAVLADDCLMLDVMSKQVVGIPVYPGSHLWTDSAISLFPQVVDAPLAGSRMHKQRFSDRAYRSKPEPVGVDMLISLEAHNDEDNKTIILEPITGYAAIMVLIKRVFFLDPGELHNIATLFAKIAALLNSGLRVYRLRYPHDYVYLPTIRQRVLALRSALDTQVDVLANVHLGC